MHGLPLLLGEFQVPHNSQSSGNDNGHEDQVFNVPAIAYAVNRQWLSLVTSIRTKDLIGGPRDTALGD